MGLDLLLDEIGHIAFYILCVSPILLIWKKAFTYQNFLIGLLTSLVIDIDHFFEYLLYLYETGGGFNLQTLLNGAYFGKGTTIVLLHGWEYVLLILLFFVLTENKEKSGWLLFVAIGMTAHLTFDALSYGFDFSVYLVTKRILHGFSSEIFCKKAVLVESFH